MVNNFLPKKDLLDKTGTMKRFENSSLGSELKNQTDIAKKQYQALDKIYEIVEIINKKLTLKNYRKSDLIYDGNYSF